MTNSVHRNVFTYGIDHQDLITHASENWDDFALGNKGDSSLRNKILNRPIWDFISDAETISLYKSLVEKVRKKGVTLDFPFRCDSPDKRRYMRMRIQPEADAHVLFQSIIEREEPRQPLTVLDSGIERDDRILRICGWCKSIKHDDRWLPIEEAVQKLGLMKQRVLPKLSHGICESCGEKISQQLVS